MFKETRMDEIAKYIAAQSQSTVEELSQHFGVSTMTIRRDLNMLERIGLISRTHGGAISSDLLQHEELYEQKESKNHDAKQRIAKRALELIKHDSIIFLDAGTTTYQIALQIKRNYQGLTIFTNDMKIATELYDSPNDVFIVGGRIQRETGSIIGNLTNVFLDALNFDICFIGVQAINQNLYLLTPSEEKAVNKRLLIDKSPVKVLVCDSSKFDKKGLFNIVSVDVFDYVVTDYEFSDKKTALLNKGTKILKA